MTLAIASHQMAPFIAVLLLMVLIGEYGAVRGRETGVRVLVALAADVAIWAQIYIYSGPESARADYPPWVRPRCLCRGCAVSDFGVGLI